MPVYRGLPASRLDLKRRRSNIYLISSSSIHVLSVKHGTSSRCQSSFAVHFHALLVCQSKAPTEWLRTRVEIVGKMKLREFINQPYRGRARTMIQRRRVPSQGHHRKGLARKPNLNRIMTSKIQLKPQTRRLTRRHLEIRLRQSALTTQTVPPPHCPAAF